MPRLTADFSSAFKRDLKRKAQRRGWDLSELERVIDLVIENIPESQAVLRRRHNMHALTVRIPFPKGGKGVYRWAAYIP